MVLDVRKHRPDDVVELSHAGFLFGPPILWGAHLLVLVRKVSDHVHSRGVQPQEERLSFALCFADELECVAEDFVVYGLHPLRTQRTIVLDFLPPDLAPPRLHGRVVSAGGPTVDQVAGAHGRFQTRRVVWVTRILHRVQVVEVPEELVETVHSRQERIPVSQVILAELPGGVAHRFQSGRNRWRLVGHSQRRSGLAHGR